MAKLGAPGRIAQRESARFTRGRSLAESHVPPSKNTCSDPFLRTIFRAKAVILCRVRDFARFTRRHRRVLTQAMARRGAKWSVESACAHSHAPTRLAPRAASGSNQPVQRSAIVVCIDPLVRRSGHPLHL